MYIHTNKCKLACILHLIASWLNILERTCTRVYTNRPTHNTCIHKHTDTKHTYIYGNKEDLSRLQTSWIPPNLESVKHWCMEVCGLRAAPNCTDPNSPDICQDPPDLPAPGSPELLGVLDYSCPRRCEIFEWGRIVRDIQNLRSNTYDWTLLTLCLTCVWPWKSVSTLLEFRSSVLTPFDL